MRRLLIYACVPRIIRVIRALNPLTALAEILQLIRVIRARNPLTALAYFPPVGYTEKHKPIEAATPGGERVK